VPAALASGWLRCLDYPNRCLDANGQHGGTLPEVRKVPLFCLGRDFAPGWQPVELSQLALAPLLCDLLGLGYSDRMTPQPIPGYRSESLSTALDAAAIANLTALAILPGDAIKNAVELANAILGRQ